MSESPYISAASAADFDDKVIQRSREVPVLVDFWAAWCGPCRSLAPVLHGLVDELDGAVELVTVDTDREMELARHFQVRSLPTVMLFSGGEAVDQFMGALPASQVRRFLQPHVRRESDGRADHAAGLARRGDFEQARGLFDQAMKDDPSNLKIRLSYVRAAIDAGKLELATQSLDGVPVEQSQEKGVHRLKALIAFKRLVDPAVSDAELESGVAEAQPAAMRELAARRVLEGDYAAAMDLQLELLKSNRGYDDNAAQKDMLAVFELADDPELVGGYRRRMYNLLY